MLILSVMDDVKIENHIVVVVLFVLTSNMIEIT